MLEGVPREGPWSIERVYVNDLVAQMAINKQHTSLVFSSGTTSSSLMDPPPVVLVAVVAVVVVRTVLLRVGRPCEAGLVGEAILLIMSCSLVQVAFGYTVLCSQTVPATKAAIYHTTA